MKRMLDDLTYIHQKDRADALGIVAKQAEQLRYEFTPKGHTEFGVIDNIVYAGMGGSALAAQLFKTWPKVVEPFEIVRDYELPEDVDDKTLCIIASYSGNTEETLSALADAEKRGAQIAIIASGGKLQELAEAKGYLFMQLPKTDQPRYAVLYNYKALLTILELANVLHAQDVTPTLHAAADFVEQSLASWLPTVPTANNPAKQLAQELLGQSVVVYAGPKMYPAAYKMKISTNENAKQVAWVGQLPEFSHNEFLGWSVAPPQKPYVVVDLRSNLEHPRIQKRFEVTARMLSGMRPEPHVVQAQGETVLQQLLWLVAFGDFVTIYLGLLNGLDPAPVELVEKFKKALEE
jgi:glucose/mannose-6-phosphate isomerase